MNTPNMAKADYNCPKEQERERERGREREGERETLVGSGQVSPRIGEITNKRFDGGADMWEICLF